MPTAVLAIGGNSLIRPGEKGTLEEQRRSLQTTYKGIAAVMAVGYSTIVTHGCGPQGGRGTAARGTRCQPGGAAAHGAVLHSGVAGIDLMP